MRGSGVGETRRRHGFSNKPLQCLKGHQMLGAPAPQHQLSQAWCRENRDGGGAVLQWQRGGAEYPRGRCVS